MGLCIGRRAAEMRRRSNAERVEEGGRGGGVTIDEKGVRNTLSLQQPRLECRYATISSGRGFRY